MTATSVKWLLGGCMVAYVVGCTVGFSLWLRRLEPLRRTQPKGWPLALPPRMHFARQAYGLGGIVLASLGILFMTPVLQTKAAPAWILGCVIALVGGTTLYAAQDVWAIKKSRRAAHQQADIQLDDTSFRRY